MALIKKDIGKVYTLVLSSAEAACGCWLFKNDDDAIQQYNQNHTATLLEPHMSFDQRGTAYVLNAGDTVMLLSILKTRNTKLYKFLCKGQIVYVNASLIGTGLKEYP